MNNNLQFTSVCSPLDLCDKIQVGKFIDIVFHFKIPCLGFSFLPPISFEIIQCRFPQSAFHFSSYPIIQLNQSTTNPVHHEVIKRYLFKYFVQQSCPQRSCAFLYKEQYGQNKKCFLFSTAISPEKKTKKSGNEIAVLL